MIDTIEISQDTIINGIPGYTSTNYGNGVQIEAYVYLGYLVNMLVKVNDSDLIKYQNAKINNVKLNLYFVDRYNLQTWTNGMHFSNVTSSWDESTVTWDTKPSWSAVKHSRLLPTENGWYEFDITSIFNEWLTSNNGLIMYGESNYNPTDFSYMYIQSSEGTNKPYLKIDYNNRNTLKCEVVEYDRTEVAEIGTSGTYIVITDHGLNIGDFILNQDRSCFLNGVLSNSVTERGSRRVTAILGDRLTVENISGQTSGDDIAIFKLTDFTNYIKAETFNLNLKTQNEAITNFNLIATFDEVSEEFDFELIEGQLIKISIDNEVIAWNIVDTVTRKEIQEKNNKIIYTVSTRDLKSITAFKPVRINYDEGDATDDIVKDMVDILVQDGISEGTINTGINIEKDWKNAVLTVKQVLDECCKKNGFQWYIDESMQLNFFDEPTSIPDAPYSLEDGGTFTDYKNLQIKGELSGYINQVITTGNDDGYGNQMYIRQNNLADQKQLQNKVWGSGVYTEIIQDSNNNETDEYTAESGTNSTNIYVTSHPFNTGDFLYNLTRDQATYVTAYATNYVECESVTSQASGDIILFFKGALNNAKEILKKNKSPWANLPVPKILTFDTTNTIEFKPGQKLNVELNKFGITAPTKFIIESVNIKNFGEKTNFGSHIVAVQRDNSNFSSHRKINGSDIFMSNF